MIKENLEYIKATLEYALNDCPVKDGDHETHFNTFANALQLVNDELNLLNISSVGVTCCDKCNDTGMIWSKDRLSARTCGCK